VASQFRIIRTQPEHCPAENNRICQGCAFHVLNHIRFARLFQQFAGRRYQVCVLLGIPHVFQVAMRLTGWACVYRVELMAVCRQIFQSIPLNEAVWVVWLWPEVNASHIKPGASAPFACPSSTTE
jgi:hypothetical protein